VEGETQNPSLNSLTGIIEAISLTDADAGVLYRRIGLHSAKPRLYVLPNSQHTFECALRESQDFLDTGHVRDAAHRVMMMFDLASNDMELATTYEQAGIVYMGMGRWEEAQANFEAADRHIPEDIDHPNTPQNIVNKKHTLMTNIGSLMVKRGNHSWASLFATAILNHPRVSDLNRGWAHLVLGTARMGTHNTPQAETEFKAALDIFTADLQDSLDNETISEDTRVRWVTQGEGNIRWAKVHWLQSKLANGDRTALGLLETRAEQWRHFDPESGTLAAMICAEQIHNERRRTQTLRGLYETAKRHNLGDLMKQITALMVTLFMIIATGNITSTQMNPVDTTISFIPDAHDHPRGNTGGK